MGLMLRDGLSFCIASNRVIFLDLKRDRYFCLPSKANRLFLDFFDGAETYPDPEDLYRHLPTELFVSTPYDLAPEPAGGAAVARSLLELPLHRPSPFLVGQALLQFGAAAASLRFFSLAQIVAAIQRRKQSPLQAVQTDVSTILAGVTAAHEQSGLFIARHDRCLPRSIAMTRHLLSTGIVPRLVFAVMMRPFQAHCWVQYEDQVLNDYLDNVRNFTPILVV